jgi:DNA-binding HxlR family transcriptional regulator
MTWCLIKHKDNFGLTHRSSKERCPERIYYRATEKAKRLDEICSDQKTFVIMEVGI